MITFQQLQNATVDDLVKDPALAKVFGVYYFGKDNAGKIGDLINKWKKGERSFDADKQNTLSGIQATSTKPNSELMRNLDRYKNWNNPENKVDQKNAFAEREKGLKELNSLVENAKQYGFDYRSIPSVEKIYEGFGQRPGMGTTSQEEAANIKAELDASKTAGQQTGMQGALSKGVQALGGNVQLSNAAPVSFGSSEAMELVNRAFKEDKMMDLKALSWWSTSPYKGEAYEIIQSIMNDPNKLANYVKQSGLTDLQNYSWWSGSSIKDAAWQQIAGSATPAQQYSFGFDPATSQTPAGTYSTPDGKPAANLTATTTATTQTTTQKAFDIIDQSDWLTADQKALFKDVVNKWDPNAEVNTDNILTQFKKISSETIDPYYQTLTNQAIDEVTRARDFQIQQREMQQEQERTQAGESIRQAKAGLEQAGMTFTGQAIKDLGKEAAYAQTAMPSVATPTQTPTQGMFYEGTVNQANRLMSTSSQAQYLRNMKELQAQAENQLGSQKASTLNIPGGNLVGGVTGNITEQQKQAQAQTLQNLYAQQQQVNEYKTPINPL